MLLSPVHYSLGVHVYTTNGDPENRHIATRGMFRQQNLTPLIGGRCSLIVVQLSP